MASGTRVGNTDGRCLQRIVREVSRLAYTRGHFWPGLSRDVLRDARSTSSRRPPMRPAYAPHIVARFGRSKPRDDLRPQGAFIDHGDRNDADGQALVTEVLEGGLRPWSTNRGID